MVTFLREKIDIKSAAFAINENVLHQTARFSSSSFSSYTITSSNSIDVHKIFT